MDNFKKYGIPVAYTTIAFLLLTLLLTTVNYFDLLGLKTLTTLKVLIPGISLLIGSIALGTNLEKKGYQGGLKFGAIFILFLLLFKVIFYNNTFKLSIIVFYLILLLSSMLGAMIGINIKKKEK